MTTARPAASVPSTPPHGSSEPSRPTESPYRPTHPVRLVTAAALFDGHDASINIMRRILQASGAEVIHLGHNRSVAEIVDCAIQEDVQGIALTSYQGGHLEYLRYMRKLLDEQGAQAIKIFGGGGGTILPDEIDQLHESGIDRIFSPDDGLRMGLQGMIDEVMRGCDFEPTDASVLADLSGVARRNPRLLGRLITLAENHPECEADLFAGLDKIQRRSRPPVLGITGTGGSGKSSLVDELVRRFLRDFPDKTLAIVSVDPSKRRTGGALLGDRIRMNSIHSDRVFMRSMATRQQNLALSQGVHRCLRILGAAGFDLLILETSGIGQSDTEIVEHSDTSLYVMTAEYGAATQLEKIDMLDFADLVAINKFEKAGSRDAIRDVRKQVQRNRGLFEVALDDMPVMGTVASQFADPGVDRLYRALIEKVVEKTGAPLGFKDRRELAHPDRASIIPPSRARYLAELVENSELFDRFVETQVEITRRIAQIEGTLAQLAEEVGKHRVHVDHDDEEVVRVEQKTTERPDWLPELEARAEALRRLQDPRCRKLLEDWPATVKRYNAAKYEFKVRDRVLEQDLYTVSLSGTRVPRVCLPKTEDSAEILRWLLTENTPGEFPYAGGVFPLKRLEEDPARMFAGEGGPERTNRRFHFLSHSMPAKRLSTAFDSVTLYGEDPDSRPDIYGKIGNSGVSVASLDDAKKLYSGFDLCDPRTSVSLTINGPAPMLLAFFLNTAIDQQCEKWIRSQGKVQETRKQIKDRHKKRGTNPPVYSGDQPHGHDGLGLLMLGTTGDQVLPPETYDAIREDALRSVRGTVQADILKEDQAQNTCIFSTEFALRMMGDIQQYFIDHDVQSFYSVSISGYHIAEAGANPITQLALTLANGFTYVEYYLSRGMNIDEFAPNLSFFFSNGLDPEYAVIGRVARRIWAKAMRLKYGANPRSQRLKYHIQTSGRSLHAQEISFNDIRTTLQALYALNDNCNSLHTNAYDEAITTPTEESVRRALAIQLIINKELGLARNENPTQGSFVIEELTDLVEKAVLEEFRRISERGGVLGAMERMYQRSKIQEESLLYESRKHSGELPIIGVNTFLAPHGISHEAPAEVIRSTEEEKAVAIGNRDAFIARHVSDAEIALPRLQEVALEQGNTFEALMEAAKVCTLGQITHALYEVGGQYRRNM